MSSGQVKGPQAINATKNRRGVGGKAYTPGAEDSAPIYLQFMGLAIGFNIWTYDSQRRLYRVTRYG